MRFLVLDDSVLSLLNLLELNDALVYQQPDGLKSHGLQMLARGGLRMFT